MTTTDRPPHHRRTRRRAHRTATPPLAVLAAVLGLGCDRPEPQAAAPPPRGVEVVQVQPADLPVEFEFVGRTESSQRVEIRARVDGYLDAIEYPEGEFVDEGDVLFRIDSAPFESRVRAARAEEAQLQARLDNAEALLARIEPLAEADAVADKELDDARGAVQEASAALEAAKARVFDAELNLGYTVITSPLHGLTSEATQREGAYISGAAGALTYVAGIDPMWVEFSVTETQMLEGTRSSQTGVVRVPEDDNFEVAITLSDGTEHPYTGRLTFQDASVSTETGSVLIRAEIPNPEDTLRPGQFVRVFVRGAVRPNAITVAQRAVLEGARGPFVWVINNESNAEQRPVTLGPWHQDQWIVEAGLRRNDRVVVNGTVGLRPGAPLNVTRILSPDDVAPQPSGEPGP